MEMLVEILSWAVALIKNVLLSCKGWGAYSFGKALVDLVVDSTTLSRVAGVVYMRFSSRTLVT